MKSAANLRDRQQKRERSHFLAGTAPLFFYSACLVLMLLVSIHRINYPLKIIHIITTTTTTTQEFSNQINNTNVLIQPKKDRETCNLFEGQWVPEAMGPLYNYSCSAIPFKTNCFLHGRKDTDFLHWRWKPDQCELPRFSPESFLAALRGKTMAFIGDSLARNQMESLVCLLETVEKPEGPEKDSEGGLKWEFPRHNFTLMSLWSRFLVSATERVINGSTTGGFDLRLDEVDRIWLEKLPFLDYAIFSDAHWFFRQNYLYERGNLIGCVYCQAPNVTDLGPGWAIRKAFQAAFRAISNCTECRKTVAILRTYSPAHIENGAWDKGGVCNRTTPFGREEVRTEEWNWEYRGIQVGEFENARSWGEGSWNNDFEMMDVTGMMAVRPDGHPGVHWENWGLKGISDCVHWCLPGPIDAWNELLFELIKRKNKQ